MFVLNFSLSGASAVRLVALNVPEEVRIGHEAELQCLYDLGGRNASLYSLKWFWRANDTDLDEKEFYRFTPTILPHKQFFPLDGIHVNVSFAVSCLFKLLSINNNLFTDQQNRRWTSLVDERKLSYKWIFQM